MTSTDRAVHNIETRAARGQREFCLTVELDWSAIMCALTARGWSVDVKPSTLYGIEVIEVTK